MARKMKDSGIEWIGEIPEGWEIKRLGAILQERNEVNNPIQTTSILSLTNNRGVIPYSEKGNQGNKAKDDLTGYKIAHIGDIVLNSMNVIIGSVGLSNYYGAVSPVYYMLFPRNNIETNIQYYNYLFQTTAFQQSLRGYGNGILEIRMRIQMQKLKTVLLPVPTFLEQSYITVYLDASLSKLNILLSKTRSSIEEYKKLKQAVITQAVTKGVRGEREMKDSGVDWIGEIPKEWVIQKIKSISSRINVGVVIRPSEYFDENGTIPFLRSINVKEYLISSDNMVYINESSNRILSKSQVHTDDILIVRDGSIGTSCVVPAEFDGANVVSMVIATPLISCDSRFICYSLNSDVGKTQFTLTKIGSALTHTSVSAVSDIIVAVPSCAEQKEIADHLDAKCAEIDKLIAKKEQLVKELEGYKKSLIYEVVTGKREV